MHEDAFVNPFFSFPVSVFLLWAFCLGRKHFDSFPGMRETFTMTNYHHGVCVQGWAFLTLTQQGSHFKM